MTIGETLIKLQELYKEEYQLAKRLSALVDEIKELQTQLSNLSKF